VCGIAVWIAVWSDRSVMAWMARLVVGIVETASPKSACGRLLLECGCDVGTSSRSESESAGSATSRPVVRAVLLVRALGKREGVGWVT
jgi:hypothetical protein